MHTITKVSFPPALAGALLLGPTLAASLSAATLTISPGSLAATKSGNDLILSFPTTSTNYYGLQMCPDLSQPWTNIQAGIQGDGIVRSVTISNAIPAGRGFYRLSLQPKPTQLLLPQSTAFAILGYDCGGISEQVYATGFDPTNWISDRQRGPEDLLQHRQGRQSPLHTHGFGHRDLGFRRQRDLHDHARDRGTGQSNVHCHRRVQRHSL